MGRSPSHQFGQAIGEVLEAAIRPRLEEFARHHGLFLDIKGVRPCRPGRKCSWVDLNGNSHDLDFVLERGGAPKRIGATVAFIETAWRRYTKHSRNKVQEIQGAIEPLAETYRNVGPFKGAVLAGVFTANAIAQLRSLGFLVVYFSYDSVIAAFGKFGVDANFDETTPDAEFKRRLRVLRKLGDAGTPRIAAALAETHAAELTGFLDALHSVVARRIERIVILALHGALYELSSVADAIHCIETYEDNKGSKPFERFEIDVRYSNGNVITGKFKDRDSAIEFLRAYQTH